MSKLSILIFTLIGCIKNELKIGDKVFSLDEFKALVKQEDITEYLLKNKYDLKQQLEEKKETILHVLLEKKLELEAFKLLDELKELAKEESDAFLKRKNEKGDEALYVAIDNGNIEIIKKILEFYSEKVRNQRLCFAYYKETILDRAIKKKNTKVMIDLIELKEKYIPRNFQKSENNKVRTEMLIMDILSNVFKSIEIRENKQLVEEEILLNKEEQKESLILELIKQSILKKEGNEVDRDIKMNFNKLIKENKQTILILASYIGDKIVIERYLDKNEVNKKAKEERTLLILASQHGNQEVVELLLTKGASIDLSDKDEITPLIIASENGYKEVVELLLNKGAAIDLADKAGRTPLWLASQNGHREVVEVLIEKEASIDLANKDGLRPLYIASQEGHKEVVELLLSKGATIDLGNKYGKTPLYIAIQNGHKEVAGLLIEKNAAIGLAYNDGSTPLWVASENGYKEIIESLLTKGAAIDLGDKYGATPLLIAIHNGHKEVVELLLSKGAAIDLADNSGRTPLYIASQEEHKEVVELLLTKGAAIDLADNGIRTPLWIASANCHKAEVVELLIEKGAAIDLANNEGKTPLWVASREGKKEVVELLIKKGASIDLADNGGRTPLFIASQQEHKEVIELLLTNEAAIDLADNEGRTPLWIASQEGKKEVVKLLISNGANVNKVNLEGKSVLEAALLNEKEEVIEELLSSCFVEGEGIVLSSNSLIVNKEALNLFNRQIRRNSISLPVSFAKIYRILNEVYSKQFIKEVERDFGKSCTARLVEIVDEVISLKELNEQEVEGANIKNDVSKGSKYEICEIIENLNKIFNKSRDLRVNSVYDRFINSKEVILNRRVKAGYYKDYTILMLEILKGNLDKVLDRVKELIKEGSDVNAADQSGNTCLALAVRKNLKEVVEVLINNRANINAVNKIGENALMIAIEGNLVDMVKILASLTKMDNEDIFKNTALILAIKKIMCINPNFSDLEKRFKDMEEIINILIRSGAKVTKEVVDLLEEKKEDEKLKILYARLK